MGYSKTQVRTWSMMGLRGTCGMAIKELADSNEDIVALSADLRNTSGFDRFASAYPDRFYNVGIAEQNLIGVAAGLADAGKIPFASTFSNFAALRGCEFVRHFMSYMNCNVKLVGIGAGFAMEFFGNTHYALEDVAALRSMPGLTIIAPCDGVETVEAVKAAASHDGPVYLRLGGIANHPVVYKESCQFEIGKANRLRSGTDAALLATGTMVPVAVKAAALLENDGISVEAVDFHTIQPLDEQCIEELYACGIREFVTIEEHRAVGGFGSAVAEYLCGSGLKDCSLLRMGADASYKRAGSYQYMLKENGLTAESIAEQVRTRL